MRVIIESSDGTKRVLGDPIEEKGPDQKAEEKPKAEAAGPSKAEPEGKTGAVELNPVTQSIVIPPIHKQIRDRVTEITKVGGLVGCLCGAEHGQLTLLISGNDIIRCETCKKNYGHEAIVKRLRQAIGLAKILGISKDEYIK